MNYFLKAIAAGHPHSKRTYFEVTRVTWIGVLAARSIMASEDEMEFLGFQLRFNCNLSKLSVSRPRQFLRASLLYGAWVRLLYML